MILSLFPHSTVYDSVTFYYILNWAKIVLVEVKGLLAIYFIPAQNIRNIIIMCYMKESGFNYENGTFKIKQTGNVIIMNINNDLAFLSILQ